MTAFIKNIIRHAVLTDEGTKWPTFDGGTLTRSDFVTASEADNCIRRLSFEKQAERDRVAIPDFWDTISDEKYAERMAAMGDDDKRGIFERGHHMELWVQEKLELGLEPHEALLCVGKKQLSFYLGGAKVSGTPDGLFLDVAQKTIRLIEVKSTDNPVTSPRANHVAQTQANAGIIDTLISNSALGNVYGWNLNEYVVLGGSILYINPSNYLTMQEFWLDYDQGAAVNAAAEKADRLFQSDGSIALPEDLPPEGLDKWGGCNFCRFKAACMRIEDLQKHKATAEKLRALMDGQTAARKANRSFFSADAKREDALRVIADYAAYDAAEKDAAEHKKALRAAIVEWIKTQPDMKVTFDDGGRLFKVSFTASERAGSIDSDKLAEFLRDYDESLDNFRKAPSKTETLLVKVTLAQ